MPHIIVDNEQTRIISGSPGNVGIRDRAGQQLGYVSHGFTEEDIAITKRRLASGETRYTTKQVLEHLKALEQEPRK